MKLRLVTATSGGTSADSPSLKACVVTRPARTARIRRRPVSRTTNPVHRTSTDTGPKIDSALIAVRNLTAPLVEHDEPCHHRGQLSCIAKTGDRYAHGFRARTRR